MWTDIPRRRPLCKGYNALGAIDEYLCWYSFVEGLDTYEILYMAEHQRQYAIGRYQRLIASMKGFMYEIPDYQTYISQPGNTKDVYHIICDRIRLANQDRLDTIERYKKLLAELMPI